MHRCSTPQNTTPQNINLQHMPLFRAITLLCMHHLSNRMPLKLTIRDQFIKISLKSSKVQHMILPCHLRPKTTTPIMQRIRPHSWPITKHRNIMHHKSNMYLHPQITNHMKDMLMRCQTPLLSMNTRARLNVLCHVACGGGCSSGAVSSSSLSSVQGRVCGSVSAANTATIYGSG
mmetsp:Transcript_104680/g.176901  ORF Transcript_104680/g.176901 Transcript_104680/m.176901 type:complete len:175 (+) Transcript_104680:1174-1698(+)